jgi:hypothetical protein
MMESRISIDFSVILDVEVITDKRFLEKSFFDQRADYGFPNSTFHRRSLLEPGKSVQVFATGRKRDEVVCSCFCSKISADCP